MTGIRRSDQMRIITDDGRVWDTAGELVAQSGPPAGAAPYEDWELSRPGGLDNDLVATLLRRVGRNIAALVTILDRNGKPLSSYAVSGKIKEVALAPYNANFTYVACDRLVISPSKVVEL